MGGTCGTHGRHKKCIKFLVGKPPMEEETWKEQVDGIIIMITIITITIT